MIVSLIESEFGTYKVNVNHGCRVNFHYWCIDAYDEVKEDWSKCPCCNMHPRIWEFNNGRSTACGCGNSKYDHFSVHAESIMSVHIRNNGDVSEYDVDQLRKNWEEYCATMINPMNHEDLRLLGRW